MQKLVRVLEATVKGPSAAPSARLTDDLKRVKEQPASAGDPPKIFSPEWAARQGGRGTDRKTHPL